MFDDKTVKRLEELAENLSAIYLPYLGRNESIDFLKPLTRIKLLAHST